MSLVGVCTVVECRVYLPHEVVIYFTSFLVCCTKNPFHVGHGLFLAAVCLNEQKMNLEKMLHSHNDGFSMSCQSRGETNLHISLPVAITQRVQTVVIFRVKQF